MELSLVGGSRSVLAVICVNPYDGVGHFGVKLHPRRRSQRAVNSRNFVADRIPKISMLRTHASFRSAFATVCDLLFEMA
jgi:hypothetical protein